MKPYERKSIKPLLGTSPQKYLWIGSFYTEVLYMYQKTDQLIGVQLL